jgi:hypothetical protein
MKLVLSEYCSLMGLFKYGGSAWLLLSNSNSPYGRKFNELNGDQICLFCNEAE